MWLLKRHPYKLLLSTSLPSMRRSGLYIHCQPKRTLNRFVGGFATGTIVVVVPPSTIHQRQTKDLAQEYPGRHRIPLIPPSVCLDTLPQDSEGGLAAVRNRVILHD